MVQPPGMQGPLMGAYALMQAGGGHGRAHRTLAQSLY